MADSHQMFIDGEWVNSSDGATRDIISPATGEVIATVQEGTAEDANRAIAAAKKAFEGDWFDSTPKDRQLALLKLADAIEAQRRRDRGDRVEERRASPPRSRCREEIPPIVDNLRFFAGAARTLQGRSAGEYMAGFTSIIRREPIGVAGLIAPWNYPLMMAIWKIGPALATGNTVVLKPSELTPLTAIKLAELAADIFPPGVFNVVTGDGEPVGDALVRSNDVGIVSLTGDMGTGKLISKNAADTPQANAPRAGRQGAGDRLRRRGHRHGGRVGQDRRLLQRRAGLHGRVPGAGAARRSTTTCSPSSCRRSSPSTRATSSTRARRSVR